MTQPSSNLLGGSLLVAGTSIGGGMLALPVLTSQAGFLPSLVIYLVCWLFMAATGLLFLEISQWMKKETNIVSMADQTLGKWGKAFAWVVYLFLFYCLTVAYMVGCGNILLEVLNLPLPPWAGPVLFTLLFCPLILIPTTLAGKLNIYLVAALALFYFMFVGIGFCYVQTDLLKAHDWSYSFSVLPIAFTSFAYQGIIPTLASYMHYNTQNIRRAILVGSFIPLIAYILWQWLILGIIPVEGPNGLSNALEMGYNAVQPLKHFIQNDSVYALGQFFAFFALITSFLGVTLGLRDFLSDGLSITNKGFGKMILAGLVFIVPLIIAATNPHLFLVALDFAGGIGCALLLGLLPIVMTWAGRYRLDFEPKKPMLPGGKWMLVLLGAFVSLEFCVEIVKIALYRL